MFDNICEALHKELETMDRKFSDPNYKLNKQELDDTDELAHALKNLKAYEAMIGHSRDYSGRYDGGSYDGDSYARGRSRTTGRYISRDGGPEYDSQRMGNRY